MTVGNEMSSYEESMRELERIRRRFNLAPTARIPSKSTETTPVVNKSKEKIDISPSKELPSEISYSSSTTQRRVYRGEMDSTRKSPSRSTGHSQGSKFYLTTNNGGASESSSVVQAFRELQNEVKVIEAERFEVFKEREELKNKLNERESIAFVSNPFD